MAHHAISAVGFLVFVGISWLLSSDRRKVAWKTIVAGIALQLVIGLIIFRLPVSHRVLLWLNGGVVARLGVARAVGEEHAVGLHLQHVLGRRLRRDDRDASAAVGEHAQDVALDAVIESDDVEFGVVDAPIALPQL